MRYFIALFTALYACIAAAGQASLPDHLDLEITGTEWQTLARTLPLRNRGGALDAVVRLGERNLAWLRHMNQFRPEGQKLSLTSAATQTGIPITAPSKYNEAIVLRNYRDVVAALPAAMRAVLVDGAAFTDNPPLPDAEYIEWGRKVDRVYSYANRWSLLSPWLHALEARRWMDVRGHYFLSREPNLAAKLAGWSSLAVDDKNRLRPLLVGLCVNSNQALGNCKREFAGAESGGAVAGFFERYRASGASVWDQFFTLTVRRDDITWQGSLGRARIPFEDPRNADVQNFLMNIEDEWKFGNWRLLLDFQNGSDIPHIEFRPNVTPHVEYLGGNKIVMDANQPLTEYDARWTIRHEFGHVIGFKDCYVEFYDADERAIFNYQLDIDNLMCSRRGKLQELHYRELKRLYD